MNIKELFTEEKLVAAKSLFTGEVGSATAIQLKENGILKEHVTKTPALLVCISGKIVYQDETGGKVELQQGDYISITPNVKHWLEGRKSSLLLLVK